MGISILSAEIAMVGVAVVHTLFNTINTILLLPIKKLLIKFCEWVVPDKGEQTHTVFLDERLFNNSPLAISECKRLCCEMAEYSKDSIYKSIELLKNFDQSIADYIRETENLTDKYEDKLGTYLVRLSNNELTENDSHAVARMLHSIGDFERIGDHAMNICKLAEEMHGKNIAFSDSAQSELNVITDAIKEIINMTVSSFVEDNSQLASRVEPLEQVIDGLKKQLKAMHINRLQAGECTIELGFIHSDLLTNYERVSDHCSNIAVYTMQLPSDKLDAHKYLKQIKSSSVGNFVDDFNYYEKKYSLN